MISSHSVRDHQCAWDKVAGLYIALVLQCGPGAVCCSKMKGSGYK